MLSKTEIEWFAHLPFFFQKKLVTNPDLSSLYQVNFRQHSCKFSQVKTFKSTSCGPHVHFYLFVSFFLKQFVDIFFYGHSFFLIECEFFLFIIKEIILKIRLFKHTSGFPRSEERR